MSKAVQVVLSVEMERSAHKPLLMRAFLRKFGQDYPPEYHSVLNRGAIRAPEWQRSYPKQWAEAADETQQLELGTPDARHPNILEDVGLASKPRSWLTSCRAGAHA